MTNSLWIYMVSALGSLLACTAGFAWARLGPGNWLGVLLGFAVGALLGVAFLEILPQLLTAPHDAQTTISAILVGIVGFFVLEKLFVWRHHHGGQWTSEHDAHAVNAHTPSTALRLLGNAVHNLFDGAFIATAFLVSKRLGMLTAVAIFAHQLAQQFSDARSAEGGVVSWWFAAVPAVATLCGALLALGALAQMPHWRGFALGVAAASMIYVAMADLIPSLHERTDSAAAMQQIALIALGVGAVALLGALL